MKFSVDLTRSAQADLIDIVEWIAGNGSTERALHVLDQIQSRLESLVRHPERGSVPSELKNLGIDKYRQVFFKPYRIIYQIRGQCVIVNLITDGRRDMSVLLQRRLIRMTL
jgi:toxin ParE1/3/4